MPLPVFLVEYTGLAMNHQGIFVELDATDGNGYIFHVTGNIQKGMAYETKPAKKPEESITFKTKTHVGWISSSDLQLVDEVCRSNPAPEKQFNGPKRINPRKPLRRCQEWAAESIQLLRNEGVLTD